jgi:RNA polymerase sigma factor (TIGR02999 family)
MLALHPPEANSDFFCRNGPKEFGIVYTCPVAEAVTRQRSEVSRLLQQARAGSQEALQQAIALVYPELRRLAAWHLKKERPDHTLQATELVHEVYLEFLGLAKVDWTNSKHFFASAARVMRNLLIDYARAQKTEKRDRSLTVRLETLPPAAAVAPGEILQVGSALDRLAALDPRQAHIVELKVFFGLSTEEIAQALEISARTVKREWATAKAWLHGELKADDDSR